MDFKSQNNQSTQPRQTEPGASVAPRMSHVATGKSKGSKLGMIIGAVLVVAVAAGFYMYNYMASPSRAIDHNKFQAVFLSNGQVYFGKLQSIDGSYAKLTDIYYLQVQQSVQPKTDTNSSSQVSLTKLGNELHGPEDSMNIASDQVLFWENLKDDGTVVKAIKTHESK